MEGGRVIFVVHLYVAVVFADYFPYAFYAETMFSFIGLVGERHSVFKGISF